MDKPLILVVEDNNMLQRLISLLAQKYGLDADVVSNGCDALAALENGRTYSLVLMDWLMPDMDGLECTQLIRAGEKMNGGHIPIVAMTANADDSDRKKCLATGMDDYMSKPFTQEQFREIIARWVLPTQHARAN
ncbi:MAG TPA: response regulator [Candidatus Obscuribacterales bacterium]